MSGRIVCNGKILEPPAGLVVRSYVNEAELELKGSPRKKPVTELVVHETVTRDVATTLRVLRRRKLGAHFLIAPDGVVSQHADPGRVRLEHAAPHNVRSVGIEIVNPVEPRLLKGRRNLPWKRTIRAGWALGGDYVLPTESQVESCAALIAWLTSDASGLCIPRHYIGLKGTKLAMSRVRAAKVQRPGIYAHTYVNHADGAWPVLYTWLRLEQKLTAEQAYECAAELASRPQNYVDLSVLESYPLSA